MKLPEPPPPAAATDESAAPDAVAAGPPAARVSTRLAETLIEPALEAGRDPRPGRAPRSNGWTPDRIRLFLDALAQCGVVADAARVAGMSKQAAYDLRHRGGRALDIAWTAAEQLARRRIADDLMSRAIHGCVDIIVRNGKVWGERHRFDNRLTLAVLARLERKAAARELDGAARVASQEFARFVDIVVDGGDGAADFFESHQKLDWDSRDTEAGILRRLAKSAKPSRGPGGEA